MITERRDRRPDGLRVPRILVVDDEPMIVDFIIRALSRTGEYGLVIMNLVMPDLDGYAMLTRLLRERPEQPVLVLSCLADVTTKVRCLELGARDYLSSPFSLDELVARVRVQLRGDGHPRSEITSTGGVALDTRKAAGQQRAGPCGPHPAGVPAAAGAHGERVPGGSQGAPAGNGVRPGFRSRL